MPFFSSSICTFCSASCNAVWQARVSLTPFSKDFKDFKEIKGDASLRKFYRNIKKNSIIIFFNKEKNKNLLIYDAINKLLVKNNIKVPKLYSQNYKNNYIEIEDLGTNTIFDIFVS